jgi:uncharacterized membrane protein (UPF0127 family)
VPWLVAAGRPVAPLEVAATRAQRRRGLLGRDGIDGALLLPRTRAVHTLGMRFPIDVAHLDRGGTVLRITTMAPRRVGGVVWRARSVLEAEAGALARWGVHPGTVLSIADAGGERAAA